MSGKACEYPGRDRVVTVYESDILKLQQRINSLEKKLPQHEQLMSRSNSSSIELSDQEILKDNYFQNSTTTDSSLFSFLDVDMEDEVIVPSNGESLRYYYDDNSSKAPISGILSLPEKEVAMSLVEKVISFIGQEYYLFDKETFLEEVRSNYDVSLRTNDPAWICYLLMTLAIGEQCSNDTLTTEAPGIGYYNKCLKLFKNNFEEPTLQLVQVHLLMAFYQQGLNRSNSSFVTYGMATRLALALGLHRKAKNLPIIEREKRRRVWWTCYVMDSIWAAKIGQPIHVDSNDISVELDTIMDLNDGFKVDILKHNSELAIVIGVIMKKMYKPNAKKTISELLNCLQELNNYQKKLPLKLRENIITKGDRTTANLYLRLNQIVIITTRPLVLSMFIGQASESSNKPEFKQAIQKCISTASANINILESLKKIGLFSNFGFWDARYLFSSLLILYMMSGGDSYSSIIKIGRNLNKEMAHSGNFTAIENEKRFKELDSLFNKMRDQSGINLINESPIASTQKQNVVSPNSLLVDDIAKIFTDISSLDNENHIDNLFQPLSKDLMPDIWKDITTNLTNWDSLGRGF